MKISYTKVGDYYIPNLTFSYMKLNENIGKYGRLRLHYLKKHRKEIYAILLMDDELYEHLISVENNAQDRIKVLINEMCIRENITEKLKEKDQMQWTKMMNNFKKRVYPFFEAAEKVTFLEKVKKCKNIFTTLH